ncbi:hypothetical protein ABT369_39615 [Dactylosporangium sp. NPDC000244]|uniref:hypothetical protein n=1 Tax=Dactylosporangium sp. NPDC000244 TaxID=3154365 RepID=UPI00331ECF20
MDSFTAMIVERVTIAIRAGGPNADGLAEAIANDLTDLINEVDDEQGPANYAEDNYQAGWHGAMHALRERLGLA